MPNTVPNQRTVTIHRERATADFLGIKNSNWQAAARDLRPHALALYLYLAANADNYSLALSPAAVRQSIGMARSTYHDQFEILVDKGYLVPSNSGHYDFYEKPHPRLEDNVSSNKTSDGFDFEAMTNAKQDKTSAVNSYPSDNTEINNNQIDKKDSINKAGVMIEKPKVKEITIPNPIATGKGREQIIQNAIPIGEFKF